jgi:hypothetical protein
MGYQQRFFIASSLRRNHFIICTSGIYGLYKNYKTKFKQLLGNVRLTAKNRKVPG